MASPTLFDKYPLLKIEDAVVGHTIPPAATWFCPMTHFSLISLEGKDAFDFLNNNLSSDIRGISEGNAHFSAHCNARGRADGCFLIFKQNETYFLRTTASLREDQVRRLRMFVLRAKVTITVSDYKGIGIAGKHAKRLLESFGLLSSQNDSCRQCSIIRLPGATECYEIYGPGEQLAAIGNVLEPQVASVAADGWKLLNILAGLPILYPETIEQFVPQMLNLDVLNGISFSKGCYPGQEIIARTHYLGKLKRRMFAFKINQPLDKPIKIGAPIFAPAYSIDQPSGSVLDFCLLKGSLLGLAVLRTQGSESGVYLHHSSGTEMHLLPLPYSVPAHSYDAQKNGSDSS